jgi:hypothetical protein
MAPSCSAQDRSTIRSRLHYRTACAPHECSATSPEPTLKNAQRARPSGAELAVDERTLPGAQATADRGRVVWRPAPARSQPEVPQACRHRLVRAAEQCRQQRRVEPGMEAEELVVAGDPSCSGSAAVRRRARVDSELGRSAADRFWCAPERLRRLVDRVACDAGKPIVHHF